MTLAPAAQAAPPAAHEIWQEFHWAFFLDAQGLLLALGRFEHFLDGGDLARAEAELDAATVLMEASGAAMRLAASFPRAAYQHEIRGTMAPPHVRSDRFSGLMSWEHGTLVALWRRLRPRFADLPARLGPAHLRFAAAYRDMAGSHVHVCARFVGETARSLRYEDRDALRSLRRFGDSRLALIDPGGTLAGQDGPAS